MKKLLLALSFCLIGSSAFAQAPVFCPTRPNGDSSNACASTAFVQNAGGGGGGITQLTGDGTAGPGTGSQALTLATVLGTPGSFGSATQCIVATQNAKGLTTAISSVTCAPVLTGDVTTVANVATLATVNSNVGTFGSSTNCPTFTVNGKGLITAASQTGCTPALGSITGFGTGVATALAVNIGSAGAPVLFNGALGTPSSGSIATTLLSGTLQATQEPAHTGDVTNSAGSLALALATVNSNVGTFGSSTNCVTFTVNGKGLITAASQTACASGAATSLHKQFFSTPGSTTYTPTTGMISVIAECVAGGGAGGSTAGALTTVNGGGGGGGGGYSRAVFTAAAIGASKTLIVGAGGTAGTAGNNPGNAGADSCLTTSTCVSGQILAAKGGAGGTAGNGSGGTGTGGAGGIAGTGDMSIVGQNGFAAFFSSVSGTIVGTGSTGGTSGFGFGMGGQNSPASFTASNAGVAGQTYGGGGSGAVFSNSASNAQGGAGASGACWMTELTSP